MELKSGWKTSEFWLNIASVGALASLQDFVDKVPTAGFPPWLAGIFQLILPLAIVYLSKTYLTARADAKSEHLNLVYASRSGQQANSPSVAVPLPANIAEAAAVLANIPPAEEKRAP